MSKAPPVKGLYRINGGWKAIHSVVVDLDGGKYEVAEFRYRQNGYSPDFERLPWREEYKKAHA